ncbi:MAG: hypothetical protein HY695_16895 [Deltaproteobacteria bacterium]|nr:hypothetical protein [Deltaproteobacteria bacterium]
MKRIFRDNRGYTLTEQVLAGFFATLIMGTLYGFYQVQLSNLLLQETKTIALEDARGALDIMVRDLRNAGSWGGGSAPPEKDSSEDPKNADDPDDDPDLICNRIYAATPKLIHVQMDLNADGDCLDLDPRENVRYELTGPTSSCSGPYVIRRNDDCLVGNVVTPVPGKLFTYFGADHTDLGENPSSVSIKRIKISFAVQLRSPSPGLGKKVTSTLSSSVELRN